MRLFLKKISRILLIGLGFSMLISLTSLWALRQSSFYKPTYLVNDVKQNQFDYIIIGSSTGLTTLNTKLIDSTINTTGINLSMDDTALSSQYLMLQHFLAQGKTAKFCVLSPTLNAFDAKIDDLNDNDYRFLMYVNEPYVYNYYSNFRSKSANVMRLSKWIPMLGVSYYNTELFYPSLLSLVKPNKRNRFDDKGNYVYPDVKRNEKIIKEIKELPIRFENKYVNKIKELCNTHNIKLICYLSPMERKKAIPLSKDYTIINHSDLLKNTRYFYDAIHVNSIGRQISSLQFAKEFKVLAQ